MYYLSLLLFLDLSLQEPSLLQGQNVYNVLFVAILIDLLPILAITIGSEVENETVFPPDVF